ncbi:hypothetical protein BC943DRAFT_328675 [Umbelopsis sp. AD052]|nr:hypothetical protein BC943DRAFT_328675 [Umbelopsis sp. AD052]
MSDRPNDSLKEPNIPNQSTSAGKLLRRSSTVSRFKKKVNTSLHNDDRHTRSVNDQPLSDTAPSEGSSIPPLPITKDERAEKLRKKAKNFFDERQKTKARAQSLWSFIDATNNFDQARFFQENAEQVFLVISETCMSQIEKIKQKTDRPTSWHSKELTGLQKTLFLLRKMFLYVPELMRNGWQRQNIATILSHILDHGNHPRLRILGFRLLLLWLNDQVVEYPECMGLFANAIPLDLLLLDEIQPTATAGATGPDTSSQSEEKEQKSGTGGNGLLFVKRINERSNEKAFGHGLDRNDRIKKADRNLRQSIISTGSQAPLFPNPNPPTYQDSIAMLHIFIINLVRLAYVAAGSPPPPDEYEFPPGDMCEVDDGIATGVGIDAASASAKFLFKIFRSYYLVKLFPDIAMRFRMDGAPINTVFPNFGFKACPPSVLRTLLMFIIGYGLDSNTNEPPVPHPGGIYPYFSGSSPAIPIMKSIVLGSIESREIIHEVLRQALVLPCSNQNYRDIVRGSMHVLGVWALSGEDERPAFLRRSSSTGNYGRGGGVSTSTSNTSLSTMATSPTSVHAIETTDHDADSNSLARSASNQTTDYANANVYLRRYFLMIQTIFDNIGETTDDLSKYKNREAVAAAVQNTSDWEGLVCLYKDALNIYRAITVAHDGIDIESQSWEVMLGCLMDIREKLMNSTEKYTIIPVHALADDLADYACETLLVAFARSDTTNPDLWIRLKKSMIVAHRWPQPLNQWVKQMHLLTRILSQRLYNVNLDAEFASTNKRNMSDYFTGNRHSTQLSHAGSRTRANKTRSRHQSIHGDPRALLNRSSGRPISSGSSGQLVEAAQSERSLQSATTFSAHTTTLGNAATSDSLDIPEPRNSSTSSLLSGSNLITRSFKPGDRRSTPFVSTSTAPGEGRSKDLSTSPEDSGEIFNSRPMSGGIRFGLKSIIPNTDKGHGMGGTSLSVDALTDSDKGVMKKETGSLTFSSKFDLHSDSKSEKEVDRKSINSLGDRQLTDENLGVPSKSNRTSTSSFQHILEASYTGGVPAVGNETLPSTIAIFDSAEFLNLQGMNWTGTSILHIWKNMICVMGNVNEIQSPYTHAIAMNCLVDIWDTLALVRACQPFQAATKPALYELAPWFFQASDLPPSHSLGRAAAYGVLCRMMCQRADQDVPEGYYPLFYQVLLDALSRPDEVAVQAVLRNCIRLFSLSLPGVNVLIPAFIACIRKELLEDSHTLRYTPDDVRSSCVLIMGSLTAISYQLGSLTIELPAKAAKAGTLQSNEFTFNQVKLMLKDLYIDLIAADANIRRMAKYTDSHCMLINGVCSLLAHELTLQNNYNPEIVFPTLNVLVDRLYWSNLPVVIAACDSLYSLISHYSHQTDYDNRILQTILSKLLDALNVHLKNYDKTVKGGRSLIISKLFSLLVGWLMAIDPDIFTGTQLRQIVFDTVEYALHISGAETEKLLPHPPVDQSEENKQLKSLSFKVSPDQRPRFSANDMAMVNDVTFETDDTDSVKESTEATLLHLLHHFNNFPPPNGPATINSNILGPGVSNDEKADTYQEQFEYFSFNDHTIIAFVEGPQRLDSESNNRIITRDITGRYAWDMDLFYRTWIKPSAVEDGSSEGTMQDISHIAEGLKLRDGLTLSSVPKLPKRPSPAPVPQQSEMPTWSATNDNSDMLENLLSYIGDNNPDCLLDASTPLNAPLPLSQPHSNIVMSMSEQLNHHLEFEKTSTSDHIVDIKTWYKQHDRRNQKLLPSDSDSNLVANVSLSKVFTPVMPGEAEKPHIPFQQSRLLMSHMGLLNYDYLREGSFQMLSKSPALFRDLRGLDRKHGRETMKIALLYVADGQEDEHAIFHNSSGSAEYEAFVNSLGWEVDIATHDGYLGGLERSLTNGTKTTYYCSSTLEMIFHDVTKMPSDAHDVKQVKKKRHIGNDHVHIVWNEHRRDYRIGTIGGDFGNAQIIVTPLVNGMYTIQIYRDSKVPLFGPLLDGMVVSQAVLGPLIRETAINAFRATVHTTNQALYKHAYSQRAADIHTITQRHKASKWSFEVFMSKIFIPNEDVSSS